MGCQTDSDGRPGLPSELCQSGSPTDAIALPIVLECLPKFAIASEGDLISSSFPTDYDSLLFFCWSHVYESGTVADL